LKIIIEIDEDFDYKMGLQYLKNIHIDPELIKSIKLER